MLDPALLPLQRVATLDLAAASGIVLRSGALYVIADDELALAVYSPTGARLRGIALRSGELPVNHALRKAQKPDFEALLELPDGSLLALGSGSTAKRMLGARIHFDRDPARVELIDLGPLYATLARELTELNIEGGAILGDQLYLVSRGNGALRENALIRVDLDRVLASLAQDRALPADARVEFMRVELPDLAGTPLSFTDLTVLGDRLLFTAAAEATTNTYDDGATSGSAVGTLTTHGSIVQLRQVTPAFKLEGVCVEPRGQTSRLWLVADADDRAERAPLLQADWSL